MNNFVRVLIIAICMVAFATACSEAEEAPAAEEKVEEKAAEGEEKAEEAGEATEEKAEEATEEK